MVNLAIFELFLLIEICFFSDCESATISERVVVGISNKT